MPASSRCPICKREFLLAGDAADCRPFCSARCRSVDLGSWLTGNYRISTVASEAEDEVSPAPGPEADGGERQR
jgi:uncharacterized protein